MQRECFKCVTKVRISLHFLYSNVCYNYSYLYSQLRNLLTDVFVCRFKLHVIVQDDTGETKLMLLDQIAKGMIVESAATLLNGSFDEVCIT